MIRDFLRFYIFLILSMIAWEVGWFALGGRVDTPPWLLQMIASFWSALAIDDKWVALGKDAG